MMDHTYFFSLMHSMLMFCEGVKQLEKNAGEDLILLKKDRDFCVLFNILKNKNKHLTKTFLKNKNGNNFNGVLKEWKECMFVFMKVTKRLEYLMEKNLGDENICLVEKLKNNKMGDGVKTRMQLRNGA